MDDQIKAGGRARMGPAKTPSPVRHWVIVFAVVLAIITYIDRVCISQAAPEIQRELGFSKEQMSLVFSAFTLAYALFEIPGGWLGDVMGPRRVLMRIVLMWSFFTAATGWAWNLASMMVCRFLFGAGEAGCFPNLTKVFTIWLPVREQVRAQGIMWLSARWGGAFTPLLVVWVFTFMNWREAFALFGGLGVVWAFWFWRWYRDNPQDHPAMSPSELALLSDQTHAASEEFKIPWKSFLASRTVWLLWLQYFCMSYGWYFYITWLPTYLREARGVELTKSAVLAGLPLFFGGIGCIFAGLMAARVAKWMGGSRPGRRVMACVGLTGAAFMLVLSTRIESPTLAMISLGLASFANDLAMPGAWGACMDVGGRYAGSLAGSMNMMGNLGGAVGPIAVAQILKYTNNNWTICFWVAAAIYIVGAISWIFIDPVTRIQAKPGDAKSA